MANMREYNLCETKGYTKYDLGVELNRFVNRSGHIVHGGNNLLSPLDEMEI